MSETLSTEEITTIRRCVQHALRHALRMAGHPNPDMRYGWQADADELKSILAKLERMVPL